MDVTDKQLEAISERAFLRAGAVHRRRLVVQSFLAGLLAACIIAIPVSLYVGENSKTEAALRAQSNAERLKRECHRVASLAQLAQEGVTLERQETAAFERESRDRLGLTQAQFDELIAHKQMRTAAKAAVLLGIEANSCAGG